MSEGRSRGIQSVEIGLRVLDAVGAAGGPASLSALAARASLSASQAHRYLTSLMATGMVVQDARNGLYDLGPGALRLGLAGLSRLDTFAAADAAVAAYARASGRTCLVAVRGNAGPTVVRWFPGRPPVVTSLAIGSVLPSEQSATGRVFQAFSDGEAPDDPEGLLARVRHDFVARLDGDLIPGLRVVSAPVFDLQGRVSLVVTSIANAAIPRSGDAEAEAGLLATCRTITESIGGSWPVARSAAE